MNRFQEALDCLRGYQYSSPFSNDSMQPSLDDIRKADSFANKEHNRLLDVLQELIDICSKPNSIKQKLDHIQDVIDCCYETDDKGNCPATEWNDDVDLADEELQEIKQAYSFRVEDTIIVNELQELLGGCCVDYIKTKVQKLIADNKDLKNELCLHCSRYKYEHLGACAICRWWYDGK